jgi:hypothetical protein
MSLDEHGFWALGELMDRAALAHGDEDGAVAPIIAALEAGPVDDIFAFEEHLARFLHALDGERYADNAGESGATDDGFLYARCYVVGQGRQHYEAVLADPSKMPKTLDDWLEAILGVAHEAYEHKTGAEWDYTARVSYETGSNGALWPTREPN